MQRGNYPASGHRRLYGRSCAQRRGCAIDPEIKDSGIVKYLPLVELFPRLLGTLLAKELNELRLRLSVVHCGGRCLGGCSQCAEPLDARPLNPYSVALFGAGFGRP